jgi:hypothetical protein
VWEGGWKRSESARGARHAYAFIARVGVVVRRGCLCDSGMRDDLIEVHELKSILCVKVVIGK